MFWGPQYRVTGRPVLLRVREDPVVCLAEALGARGLESAVIGIEMEEISASLMGRLKDRLRAARFVDAHADFLELRTIHRDYIGDMFRVYALGEPPDDAVRIHEALDQVNEKMIAAVKPGAVASDLYELGAGEMRQRGCDLVFDFVGHGIGLDVHEPPNLIQQDTTVLRENMVIVLEVSTRRHDLGHFSAEIPLLVTGSGCELLSELPYGLAVV